MGITITGEAPGKNGHAMLAFVCDCGSIGAARKAHILSGATKSCGCGRIKHGLLKGVGAGEPRPDGYTNWRGMMARCNDPNNKDYLNYGGRGIAVCSRWHDVALFLADMGPRPSKGHSVDRINVDGHYEPGNCRWATATEQNRNRRNTVLTMDGAQIIRGLHASGASHRKICELTGVGRWTVENVIKGTQWT